MTFAQLYGAIAGVASEGPYHRECRLSSGWAYRGSLPRLPPARGQWPLIACLLDAAARGQYQLTLKKDTHEFTAPRGWIIISAC